jgi:hypothetical protein
MNDLPRPFPTSGILPEVRQIGRRAVIDRLENQVRRDRHHTWLVAERRTGKSSVAQAVLDRTRATHSGTGWALRIDLKNGALTSSAQLALALAAQATSAGVEVTPTAKRWSHAGRSIAGAAENAAAIASALGIDEAATAKAVSQAVRAALGSDSDTAPSLQRVLSALQAAAVTEDRVIALFIDEVQELTYWSPDDAFFVEAQLAAMMDQPDGHVVAMLAGSDGEAIQELRAKGRPLYYQGLEFVLPAIADEDWRAGLRERFREIGVTMPREHIDDILEESNGHPLRTMSVCAQLQGIVRPGEEVHTAYVIEAVAAAKRQPSWEL